MLLLTRKADLKDTWEVLVKPGKKAKIGTRIHFGGDKLIGEVIDIVEEGNRIIRFEYDGIFEEILDELGQMPLPPYITHKLEDKNRYQTVYAKHEVLQQRLLPDYILQQSYLKKSRPWELILQE